MIQAGDGAGLALQALPQVRTIGQLRRQDLDCDDPVEPRIPRAVDLPHSAGADGREDLVRPEFVTGRQRHTV